MVDDSPDRANGSIYVEHYPPEELFSLLSNEIRVAIVRAAHEVPGPAPSFSELFDRVDLADTGNFNYHLNRLTGRFLRKVPTDDGTGYELTHAGRQVVGALYAGTYTADATIEPFSVGWDCQLCGGEMLLSYSEETAHFRCEDCDGGASFTFPPGTLEEYDRDDLPAAFAAWWHQEMTRVTDGFCPICGGRVDGTLLSLPEGPPDVLEPSPSYAGFDCRRCGERTQLSASTLATMHPIVEGFLAEHGFDVTARHGSQIWGELDVWHAEVRSTEPMQLTYHFGHDNDHVLVDIDADASVREVRRDRGNP